MLLAGEVAERLKAHAWKACVGLPLPRVRIPPSPPLLEGQLAIARWAEKMFASKIKILQLSAEILRLLAAGATGNGLFSRD